MAKLVILGLVLFGLTACLAAAEPNLERFAFAEAHMGTQFVVTLYAPSEAQAQAAAAAAFDRIGGLDDRLSDYQPESELTRLSRSAGRGKPVAVSDDLWNVLARSEQISKWSDGAFDVTVGPYVRLWRRARRTGQMPSEERLEQARSSVGFDLARLNEKTREVELTRAGMRLDLGAIAKGYAADEALEVLRAAGVASALVNAGGDLALGDPPPGEPGWRVAVAPMGDGQGTGDRGQGIGGSNQEAGRTTLVLANCGVATSGDAYQYVEFEGRRYSHVIDPRTGVAVTIPSSITVIAPDCTTADALASALSVLGPEGLEHLDEFPDTAALVVRVENGEERRYRSHRMDELLPQDSGGLPGAGNEQRAEELQGDD